MAGLPPFARLRRASDFAALRNNPGRIQANHFLVYWIPSRTGRARLGLAVSRKVSKLAVQRNRIKRIVRESFRPWRGKLSALDVLVIARATAAGSDNPLLRADLERAWQKLQALKPGATPGTIGG